MGKLLDYAPLILVNLYQSQGQDINKIASQFGLKI